MPSWEMKSHRFWDGDIWEHRPDDSHNLFLYLGIRKSLNPDRVVALYQKNVFRAGVLRYESAITDRNSHKEDPRAREEVLVVEALPHGVPTSFRVCIQPHLDRQTRVRTGGTRKITHPYFCIKPELPRKLHENLRICFLPADFSQLSRSACG